MERWAAADVLAAAKGIDDSWASQADSEVVKGTGFLMLCQPAHLISPTSGRVQAWITSQRPFSELRPDVEHVARQWGAGEVSWWVDADVCATADDALQSSGAKLVLTSLLLARTLEGGDADSWLAGGDPPGVNVHVVDDGATFRALTDVGTAGWGRTPPSGEVLVQEWERLRADLQSKSAFALLGRAEGMPASVGHCRLFGSVARLFGAVTLPEVRRRGLYSSVLKARCRLGREYGATLALTKARPTTSAPILQRAGFRAYQTEKCWQLRVNDL